MGIIFTFRGAGWLIGALSSGKIYDLLPNRSHLILGVCLVMTSIVNALIPISNYYVILVSVQRLKSSHSLSILELLTR